MTVTADWVISCVCGLCWCQGHATEQEPICDDCRNGIHMAQQDAGPRPGAAPPRKCARHLWDKDVLPGDRVMEIIRCVRCHTVQDPMKVRAGRNNRARGNRHELHIARQYGGEKIGPLGGPADVVSALFAIQVKTHTGPAPSRLLRLLEAMDTGAGGRTPIVIDRYLRQGRLPVDIVTLRGSDWLALHGPTEAGELTDE